MIKILYNEKVFEIEKEKIFWVLSRLEDRVIDESEIEELIKKYKLLDEYFLSNVNKL